MLCRHADGTVYDPGLGRPVAHGELIQDLRAGRRFSAHDHNTGSDCTHRLLAGVLITALGLATATRRPGQHHSSATGCCSICQDTCRSGP
ncbi:hypothetical protein [Streptomyces luteireticuli]|uniref:hypothetical protein n=1 Tax=Streptomyces luteireticuli TaxID=173858 RepID=UPI003558ECA0